MPSCRLAAVLVIVALGLSGCVALAPAALGSAALSGGASSLAKAGTEFTMSGGAYRTFSSPVKDVYEAVHETFRRLEITVTAESFGGGEVEVHGVAIDRTFAVKLEPITPMLTQMKLTVRVHGLGKDRATAAELISQTEQVLRPESSAFAR